MKDNCISGFGVCLYSHFFLSCSFALFCFFVLLFLGQRSLKSQAGRRHPANVKAGQTRAALHALKALFLHPNPNRPNPSFPSPPSSLSVTLLLDPLHVQQQANPNQTPPAQPTGQWGGRDRERETERERDGHPSCIFSSLLDLLKERWFQLPS
ncbi:hypothetical protein MHYP_G00283750 [Metynnis hypsauchen]